HLDPENIGFCIVFSDHMFLANFKDGEWKNARIVPYGPLSMSPATSAIHYGQSIFEGMKAVAHQSSDEAIALFRPEENAKRFNRSAKRMAMPEVPEELFMSGLQALLELDRHWVPRSAGGALYIRPYMFATDDYIGVKPSDTYCFAIFTCPVGPYYTKALRVKVEEEYSRAAPGGVGFTKCAGNYAGALYPTALAQKEGFDQVLWTDPLSHEWVEETGTTNFFAVYSDRIVTPALSQTLLAGITRDSVIQALRHLGHEVEERPLSVQELKDSLSQGQLAELFITGTAATLVNLDGFGHRGEYHSVMEQGNQQVSREVKHFLDELRCGATQDPFGWVQVL
ncbi:MAG: branched-chain amino acid aminotransferase, partial [Bacteroidia bacterium]